MSPTTGKYRSIADQAAKPQEEVPTEALTPVDAPERALHDALEAMRGQDWRRHFDALTTVRACTVYHPHALAAQLHAVTSALVKSVGNLRSVLAKHAIVAIGDVVAHAQRKADPCLGEPVGLLAALVRRAADANHFLAEEAERVLLVCVDSCSAPKVLAVMTVQAAHKSERHRAKSAKVLHALVSKLGAATLELRDTGAVLVQLTKLLGDSNFEVRHWARLACTALQLAAGADFERACLRAGVPPKQVSCLQEAAQRARAHDDAVAPSSSRDHVTRVTLMPSEAMPHPAMQRTSGAVMAGKHRKHSITGAAAGPPPLRSPAEAPIAGARLPAIDDVGGQVGTGKAEEPGSKRPAAVGAPRVRVEPPAGGGLPAELEPLIAIAADVGDSDWKVRSDGLQRLRDLVQRHPREARHDKASAMLYDALLARCGDQNQKVCVLALSCFAEVLPVLAPSQFSPPHVSRLVATVAGTLASKAQVVVGEAQRVLGVLAQVADVPTYVHQLSVVLANAANPRVKVVLLGRVYSLIEPVHGARPEVVVRYVLPPCLRLLSDPRADVRQENNRVLVKCYQLLGDEIYDHIGGLAPAQAQKLQDLLED